MHFRDDFTHILLIPWGVLPPGEDSAGQNKYLIILFLWKSFKTAAKTQVLFILKILFSVFTYSGYKWKGNLLWSIVNEYPRQYTKEVL